MTGAIRCAGLTKQYRGVTALTSAGERAIAPPAPETPCGPAWPARL
jgi:hypothetical protein